MIAVAATNLGTIAIVLSISVQDSNTGFDVCGAILDRDRSLPRSLQMKTGYAADSSHSVSENDRFDATQAIGAIGEIRSEGRDARAG